MLKQSSFELCLLKSKERLDSVCKVSQWIHRQKKVINPHSLSVLGKHKALLT